MDDFLRFGVRLEHLNRSPFSDEREEGYGFNSHSQNGQLSPQCNGHARPIESHSL